MAIAAGAPMCDTVSVLSARVDELDVPPKPRRMFRRGSRLWREWCFAKVALRHFRLRFLFMAALLVGGAALFQVFEPERRHSFLPAMYMTWSLVFGEPPEAFPQSVVLRVMFFVVPVLGLTVIIEAIIDFALMLRDRRRYERSWCTMLAASLEDHIVLVGFGKLGYRIFNVLRGLGEAVVVIERDPTCQFLDELRREGSPLLLGDARRDALLAEANVAKARSIILATDDDLANLEIALDARRMAPKIRVVLRMFDQNIADKMSQGFNIHMAMSQSALSAPTFAISAVASSIVSSFIVDQQLVVMQRFLVREDGPLRGNTIGQIAAQHRLGIVQHQRPGERPDLFPAPDVMLQPGDGVVLQGPLPVLQELWRLNAKAASARLHDDRAHVTA